MPSAVVTLHTVCVGRTMPRIPQQEIQSHFFFKFAIMVSNASILFESSALVLLDFIQKTRLGRVHWLHLLGGLVKEEKWISRGRSAAAAGALSNPDTKLCSHLNYGKWCACMLTKPTVLKGCPWSNSDLMQHVSEKEWNVERSRGIHVRFPCIQTGDRTRRTEVEFPGEIKIPQGLRSCRCYYTLLQRPCSPRGCCT